MSASHYFQFLSAVWDQLPEKDRERFGELWEGYEQVLGAIYQKYAEVSLNMAVENQLPYTTERWLPYTFNSTNFVKRSATVTSSQDLSVGINLSKKYMLRIQVDGANIYEMSVQGKKPNITYIDEIVSKINLAVGYPIASTLFQNSILFLKSPTSGAGSSIEVLETTNPYINACELVLGIARQELPKSFPRFRYPYTIPYSKVASIPSFRDKIRNDNMSITLSEGVDYIVENGNTVVFLQIPPESLWATITHTDEENPWANFGFLTGIYQKNSPRYVGVIQGLWYAFWNGPKPTNIKKSLYLLFGLPTAAEGGTITAITASLITLRGISGEIYTYDIPFGLQAVVSIGQTVIKFDPLVNGIEVFDKINYPGFIEKEAGREGIRRFLTEDASLGQGTLENPTDEDIALKVLEEYTFLPQISVDAFIYPDINLQNVRSFLDSIRPLNKTYLFQIIVGAFKEVLGLIDRSGMLIDIDWTSNLDGNETSDIDVATLLSYETTNIDALNLDPYGILFDDNVQLDVSTSRPSLTLTDPVTVAPGCAPAYRNYQIVFSSGSLIDSFTA